jgi:ABC-type polysaccharide/polyol phosphate transport system ATPase subunit
MIELNKNKKEEVDISTLTDDDFAVIVDNVSKLYRLYPGQRARIIEWITFGKRKYHHPFWALKDVSIKLPKGKAMGIIGPNGSGKSTLLKLIASTSNATSGEIKVNGSVAALLELGAGFHPDFTGRQNIYMNGQIFGLSEKQIDDILEDIIEFSELGRFIDMPVKTYSSGMYARLGFAVASHLDPDILIVDEALSVGDSYFQRKSLDRIINFREAGKTIIFVSHIMPVVQRFCDEVIWLEDGKVKMYGPADEVIKAYDIWTLKRQEGHLGQRMSGSMLSADKKREYRVLDESWGSQEAKIIKVEMFGEDGEPRWHFDMHERNVTIRFHYYAFEKIDTPIWGINFHSLEGIYIFGTSNYHIEPMEMEPFEGIGYVDYTIDRMHLHKGQYFLSVGLYPEPDIPYWKNPLDWHNQMYEFTVMSDQEAHGIVPFQGNWTSEKWQDSQVGAGIPSILDFDIRDTQLFLQKGWWDIEKDGDSHYAWTKESAHAIIMQQPEATAMKIKLNSNFPKLSEQPIEVSLIVDGTKIDTVKVSKPDWQEQQFKLPATKVPKVRHIEIVTTPTWCPKEFDLGDDLRQLGVGISYIEIY